MRNKNLLKDQRGFLTLDFIFAAVLVFIFSAILFSFAITLSVVEVVQYISYATARNYSLAHTNEAEQRARGLEKFQQLSTDPRLRPLFEAGWFSIRDVQIRDFNSEYPNRSNDDANNFYGARIPFSAPILYKRVPLLGTTASDPEGFQANISSFLSREPTHQECRDFTTQRMQGLENLGYSGGQGAAIMMDNGC